MDTRIKLRAHRFDGLNIERAQGLFHLLHDQLNAGTQLLGRAGRFERKLKVVEHRKKLLDGSGNRIIAKLVAFASFAFTGVLKLGLQAGNSVEKRVSLRLETIKLLLCEGG